MFCVYAIKNTKGKIYIGQTADLERRIRRHNGVLKNKSSSFTCKQKGSWRIVYQECFETREKARERERKLKSFRGREFIKNKILLRT